MTGSSWTKTDSSDWTDTQRSVWQHFDTLAAAFAGVASTVFALVYVTGRDAPIPHTAAFFLLVTIAMNFWSLLIRYWHHYFWKRALVYVSMGPFFFAMGLLMYLMALS